jgi:hypothetical protein
MRYRHVHLDFHTSEAIPGIGRVFSKGGFQDALRTGHVDAITVFAKCHHGWAYFPSEKNEMHPNLEFDLLGSMIEAAHEIDVRTPVYVSAGLDEKEARRHPEWLMRGPDERTNWAPDFLHAGYHQFCMNSPYLDMLIPQIEEVLQRYDADGLFLDIVGVRMCYCQHCVQTLLDGGEDPRDEEAVRRLGERVYANYTARVQDCIDRVSPGTPVFHNSGHITRGRRDLAAKNSHLEIESLPTGGWGYDHFPLSARYAQTLGMAYMGMTGKFHTTWGEFGGFKHPNALRYETSLSLANGARCSVGDQLHPEGAMDPVTYRLIGAAYEEVERKEPWCTQVTSVVDVGLLSHEAVHARLSQGQAPKNDAVDSGAVRALLEGGFLFDVLDAEASFQDYRVVILPDAVRLDNELSDKLRSYVRAGGKILATGTSALGRGADRFELDFGVTFGGEAPFVPDYLRPVAAELLEDTAYVMYAGGVSIREAGGRVLAVREVPYFNRDVFHFCSHQHTPSALESTGPGVVEGPAGVYIAWNVFQDYGENGSLHLRNLVTWCLDRLLDTRTVETTLPSKGIATFMRQPGMSRRVLHLLYGVPVKRGRVEVIEDLPSLHNVGVTVRVDSRPTRVYLAPQETDLAFTYDDGAVRATVPVFSCHQMVVLDGEE